MSLLKKMFGRNEQPQRKLSSAEQLKVNDIVVLSDSFALPEILRAQQFQIIAVNTYEYEHFNQTEWVLKGSDQTQLYLSLDADDEIYLKFSLKLSERDVETLLDLNEFAAVFEAPGRAFLQRQQDNALTAQWSASEYQQQIFAQVGYFHRKDHRHENLSAYQGKDAGEQFELYQLFDQQDERGIDVEVWHDGDTEVFLTLYRPLTDIVDMYPGS